MMKALLTTLTLVVGSANGAGGWDRLPPLPDEEGFAGAFAGVSGGVLLVAGGANFPDKKPWDGGKKVWYDTIFVLDRPAGAWKVAGRLPRPLGYGVSVTHRDAVVCVGGSDADRHYADAFRLEWKAGRVVLTNLPALPGLVANASGALVGDTLYVAGGQDRPEARDVLKAAWKIDLAAAEPKWRRVADCPGGRMLAVAAAFDGAFWLVGGVDLVVKGENVERRYLRDAYRYDRDKGWARIADLPRPVAAAPSPAPADATGFYLMGGDDGSQVGVAPGRHRGFGRQVLRYDPKTAKWAEAGAMPVARVTVPCVLWNKSWVIPSGEARPGVRSPGVWSWTPGKKE
jgi:N-acetylneuraminic acid mutarotase